MSMAKTVPMIGIDPGELRWIRMLVQLLRHSDPSVPELARQALLYLSDISRNPHAAKAPHPAAALAPPARSGFDPLDYAG